MFGLLDISTSGMIAQRTRVEAAAANIANQNTLIDAEGKLNPYRRREVYFAPGDPGARSAGGKSFGVHVAEITTDPNPPQPKVYDPSNPYAFKDGPYAGYVATTGINPVQEQISSIEAARAYEANVMAAEASKQLMASALRLLA